VEGGDAEAADAHRDGGQAEARRNAGAGDPSAASATPTGISHHSERRSETAPNSGLDDRRADGDGQQEPPACRE
jgi:hypothetical protein